MTRPRLKILAWRMIPTASAAWASNKPSQINSIFSCNNRIAAGLLCSTILIIWIKHQAIWFLSTERAVKIVSKTNLVPLSRFKYLTSKPWVRKLVLLPKGPRLLRATCHREMAWVFKTQTLKEKWSKFSTLLIIMGPTRTTQPQFQRAEPHQWGRARKMHILPKMHRAARMWLQLIVVKRAVERKEDTLHLRLKEVASLKQLTKILGRSLHFQTFWIILKR